MGLTHWHVARHQVGIMMSARATARCSARHRFHAGAAVRACTLIWRPMESG